MITVRGRMCCCWKRTSLDAVFAAVPTMKFTRSAFSMRAHSSETPEGLIRRSGGTSMMLWAWFMVTAPSEKDLRSEKLGPYVEKYLKAAPNVTTENRMKILRLIENLSLGTAAVGYRTESMHGAGSPQAQRIMIARQGNLNAKKKLAKAIAHIKE